MDVSSYQPIVDEFLNGEQLRPCQRDALNCCTSKSDQHEINIEMCTGSGKSLQTIKISLEISHSKL